MVNTSSDSEEWRPITGWEGSHSVSSLGKVRTEVRKQKWRNQVLPSRVLKQQVDKWGYHYVFLHSDGVHSTRNVHVLVADAFIGGRPDGMQTDHIDHNKGNNSAGNLRYLTPSDNVRSRIATGSGVGDRNPKSKIRSELVNIIRRLHREGVSCAKIGRSFGVSDQAVFGVVSGRCWSHVPEENT